MSTLNNIIKKISVKEELAKHQVELGLVQDITLDLNTIADSLTSIKPALLKLEDLLIKNIKDRKSTRLNSSHSQQSRMPSSA